MTNDILKDKMLSIPLYKNKGFVILKDCMPRVLPPGKTTADYAIPEMARVSYGNIGELKSEKDDIRLINYLMENSHTSPFEGVKFSFIIQCPIFVARQLLRHRTANVNEYSMRYSKAIDSFYFPDARLQDKVNKQSSISTEIKDDIIQEYKKITNKSASLLDDYEYLINNGISREVARTILPTSEFTKMVWCIDLHNLFRFLKLRMDKHAQEEIRVLAEGIFKLISDIVPIACNAFKYYQLDSITFFPNELKIIRYFGYENNEKDNIQEIITALSDRQKIEFLNKLEKIKILI